MTTAAVAALAGLALATALIAGIRRVPVGVDEAWLLQVITRVRRGEVLYRDVFYGAGPLPVWIGLLAGRGRRRQMLALRVVTVAYFVTLLLASTWALAAVNAPGWAAVAVWIGSLAYAPPTTVLDTHYTGLALLAAVVAIGTALHVGGSGAPAGFAVAGAVAGASFWSKQTIGIAATVAVTGLAGAAAGLSAVLACLGGGLAITAVCVAPLARAGALGAYLRRAFLNKTTYVAYGRVGVRAGIREALGRPFPSRVQRWAYAAAVFGSYLVLPAVALACVAALRAIAGGNLPEATRLADMAVVALGGVVAAAAIPRADLAHVRRLFPVGLLTVALAASARPSPFGSPPKAVLVTMAAAGFVLTLLGLAVGARRIQVAPRTGPSGAHAAPYFDGLPVIPASPADGGQLRESTGGRVFLLRPDAAFWYLSSGLQNPTPYDYPYSTVFGRRGQQEVIEGIRAGDIPWVCWHGPIAGPLRPAELEEFVATSMVAVDDTPAGVLYRMAPDGGPEARRS